MKVLHIGKFFPPFAGGIENFMGDLLPALERFGVRCTALVHDHDFGPARTPRQDVDGTSVVRVPCFGRLLYAPVSPSFPAALKRTVRRFAPELIHLHLPNTSAFWALGDAAAKGLPWVVHWHADVAPSKADSRLAIAYRFYRPLERALLLRARLVVATSPPYLRTSAPLAPWQRKCRIVPLGIDPLRLPAPSPEAQRWAARQWRPKGLRVLAVGRLTYYKGHDILIRAAAADPVACVLIVGKGEKRMELDRLIRRLGVEERVALTGELPAERLQALIASCECLCLPSVERTEAFGLVLLEAMRYGKPVVAAEVAGSGMGWVVEHGRTGMLCKPGDAGDLASFLRSLAMTPGLGEKMGRAARERFEKCFHIDRVAEKLKGHYQSVLAHPGGRQEAV